MVTGAQPERLEGFENDTPEACEPSGGLGGAVSLSPAEPEPEPRAKACPAVPLRHPTEAGHPCRHAMELCL